jgi:hypothetical protein
MSKVRMVRSMLTISGQASEKFLAFRGGDASSNVKTVCKTVLWNDAQQQQVQHALN